MTRRRLTGLAALSAFALLAGCKARPPSRTSAHPDARRSGPFWEREQQRD